ncbi:MAG: ATP-binding protein [Chloroflexota bacterium]
MNNKPELVEILKRAFPGFQDEEAEQMVGLGTIRSYEQGVRLTTEGAYETTFFLLIEGEVQVTKKFSEDEERLLKILRSGDFFGEMAIIHDAPRAATITTLTPVEVLQLEREAFSVLLNTNSRLSLAMVREVSRRLRENDEIAINDLRHKAAELSDAYTKLSQLEAARRQFLTTIAHELRTPLMAANGFMHIIRSGKLQGEALVSAVETVARNLQEIISLTNDILFLQEMDLILPEFQSADLGEIVAQVVASFHAAAKKQGVVLILKLPIEKLMIQADAKSLSRAFAAVLDNAIKFSPNGGQVLVGAVSLDGWAQVSVQDCGVGIAPEVLPRIFERFFHLDEVDGHLFRGAGLGLSIARQVIEQHGGEIRVESEPGKGSTFSIGLKRI